MIVIAGTIRIDSAKKDEAATAALEIMKETHKEEVELEKFEIASVGSVF